jgi:hypothetical protein
MNEAVFPSHVIQALDQLMVPSLPKGFGDRLVARIASSDLPEESMPALSNLFSPRRGARGNGWRRSGRMFAVSAAFGLATATAAASGVFGEPVYIPVVSQALAQAQIVEMPTKKPATTKPAKAPKAPPEVGQQPAKPELSGTELVIQRIGALRSDPAYRSLPRSERLARAKTEIDALLADGKAQKADVKAALRQLATERKALGKPQAMQDMPDRNPPAKPRVKKPQTPEQKEKIRDAVSQLTEAQRAELKLLRQRRRDAAPQDRRAIQAEINAFWKRTGIKRGANDSENAAP